MKKFLITFWLIALCVSLFADEGYNDKVAPVYKRFDTGAFEFPKMGDDGI